MAFGSTAKTSTPKSLGNIDKDDLNSNQEAVPVPYIAGRNRVPLTWITPCYNRQAKKVSSGSSKAGSAGDTYKYQVDLVAAISVCGRTPLSAISQIIVNHVVVWSGNVTRRAGHPYEAITVAKYGQFRIYWGQTDQPVQDMFTCHFNATKADDTFDAQPARTDVLPPYRGVSLLVMQGFQLGSSTQMPVVEVVVDRAPLWFADQPAPDVSARGSNVVALLYEWMADDWFGTGLDPARLNEAAWVAAYAAADAAGHRVSPLITDQTGFRQVVAQLLEYFDGWVRRDGGSLSVGFWEHGNTDTSGLPALNDTAMVGEPELKPSGYGDTINQANVAFRDSSLYFHDASWPANSAANLRIVGERRPQSVARPWIITAEHAVAYAAEYVNLYSQPHYTGPVKAKREWVAQYGIGPGSLLKLDSGTAGLEIVCRVTEAGNAADRDGTVDLTLDSERGLYPSLYTPEPPPRVGDFLVVAAVIEHARVLTLPSGLTTSANVQLTVLAERPDPTLTGFRTYLSRDNESYDLLVQDSTFAVRGLVAAVYPADTAALDTTGITVTLDGVDADLVVAQSDAARDSNTLLLFVDGEIMSVGEVTALGNGQYQLALKRALYGTAQAAHFLNAEVWLHFRADLPILEAVGTIVKGQTVYLKLPTHNATADQALADAVVVEYTVGLQSAVGAAFGLTLDSYAQATATGQVESHVTADWLNYADQGISEHEVALKRADAADTAWDYRVLSTPHADWTVAPSTLYAVKIRSINDLGEPSDWSPVQTITSRSISGYAITGLELVGMANGLVNEEPDFHFAWRLNSPARVSQVGGANGQPLTAGLQDPAFAYYLVQVLDATTRALAKQDKTSTPGYVFTESMNSLAFGGSPHAAIIFRVAAIDDDGGPSDWAEIAVNNPPTAPCTNLSATSSFRNVWLTWTNPKAPDLDHIEIGESADGTLAGAIWTPAGLAEAATRSGLNTGDSRTYWVRAVDTFGNLSANCPAGAGLTVLLGSVQATDLEDFAVTATKRFSNTVDLEGDAWTNNSPAPGSIAWNAHQIVFGGQVYPIPAGSTNQPWVWWHVGDAAYSTAAANPINTVPGWNNNAYFQIGRNLNGAFERAWTGLANAVIGSAYIEDEAVVNSKIANLAVDNAKIGHAAVDTLQLAGQAVTIPLDVKGADTNGQDWTTVVQITVQSSGARATITAGWGFSWASTSSASSRGDVRLVRSDNTTLESPDFTTGPGTTLMCYPFTDPQTLVGPTTYTLQMRRSDAAAANLYPFTARTPKLIYLETKR